MEWNWRWVSGTTRIHARNAESGHEGQVLSQEEARNVAATSGDRGNDALDECGECESRRYMYGMHEPMMRKIRRSRHDRQVGCSENDREDGEDSEDPCRSPAKM
jgi:hypothetical protein